MFSIVQAHKTDLLLTRLGDDYSQKISQGQSIFDEFVVLVPSMVLGDWLQKAIASRYGINTMITTTFWGQYQWQLMQLVLEQYNAHLQAVGKGSQIVSVPEVAVLSSAVMQWRIFAYLCNNQSSILADKIHPLHDFLDAIIVPSEDSHQNESRLWQIAKDFAKVFNRYLTHRHEWLDLWGESESIHVARLIEEKDQLSQRFLKPDQTEPLTPDWLVEHYVELEAVQGYLWRCLFAGAYQYRQQIEHNFWEGIANKAFKDSLKLPRCLYLFTVQQLPQSELLFLQKLSEFIDIKLFHYNPSQMFWADIVDKKWLAHQEIVNAESVYLRDYGHTLLSRLGKQSRETFASLASLSGNEHSQKFILKWDDNFQIDKHLKTQQLPLLQRLQYDVLMLEETTATQQLNQQLIKTLQQEGESDQFEESLRQKKLPNNRRWQLTYDDSLQIHNCYSLQRQLEVLRSRIAFWLNEPSTGDTPRQLADIVVLLPDVENNYDLIRSVFVEGFGQDGLLLPARITGVVDKSSRQLWHAICGYYRLLGANFARFEAEEVLEWLALPTMAESLGLTHEQVARGAELLLSAGFIRGFDEQHLQQSLDAQDADYRFSFAYALDKLVLGLLMPQAEISNCLYPDAQNWAVEGLAEQTIPLENVTLNDAPIINALCRVYQSLDAYRNHYKKTKSPSKWIESIETQVIHPLFSVYDQSRELRAIFKAMNGFKRSLKANNQPNNYYPNHVNSDNPSDQPTEKITDNQLNLRLEFVLESIETELENQQISAEPTGVITFARFGSLRTVPYPLIVMLNMNLSEFPRQDKNDRYDLMMAGLPRRGDRSSEDDDNGAFLDALLCATESCWIFYNGRSLQDDHEHLPASPVTELLQFLQGDIAWQLPKSITPEQQLQQDIEQYIPKLIKDWLVIEHAALPFSTQEFETTIPSQSTESSIQQLLDGLMVGSKLAQKQQIPPTPLWQKVYHQLNKTEESTIKKPTIELLTASDYKQVSQFIVGKSNHQNGGDLRILDGTIIETHLQISQLVKQVSHPAMSYLKQQNISIRQPQNTIIRQEPLSLDGLSHYQISNILLENPDKANDHLRFDTLIPAGVIRDTILKSQQQEISDRLVELSDFLQNKYRATESAVLTHCQEFTHVMTVDFFDKPQDIQLKGQIPHQPIQKWVRILPNSARAKHLLTFWLSHLYWQVVRQTTHEQVKIDDGSSICSFNRSNNEIKAIEKQPILCFAPMAYQQAHEELEKWIRFAHICGHYPIVMMPEDALIYLANASSSKYGNAKPSMDKFQRWLGSAYGTQKNQLPYANNSKHPVWQYVLGTHQDNPDSYLAFSALSLALTTLSESLFGTMYKALISDNSSS